MTAEEIDPPIPDLFPYEPEKTGISKERAERLRDDFAKMKAVDIARVIEIAKDAHGAAKARETDSVVDAITRMLEEHGLDFDEVYEKATEKAKGRAAEPVRFRHPKNPDQTWTGRGRLPVWLKELKEAGKDIEQFRVAP